MIIRDVEPNRPTLASLFKTALFKFNNNDKLDVIKQRHPTDKTSDCTSFERADKAD